LVLATWASTVWPTNDIGLCMGISIGTACAKDIHGRHSSEIQNGDDIQVGMPIVLV